MYPWPSLQAFPWPNTRMGGQTSNGAGQESNLGYDHYSVSSVGQNVATQFNPYAGDHGHLDTSGAAFFGAQGAYNAPPQPVSTSDRLQTKPPT